MAIVRLKDLKPGMVLASHAMDPNGRLLLTVGEVITDKHIRTFKAWGISELDIKDSEEENTVVVDGAQDVKAEQVPTQVSEEVDELFRYTNRQHPAMKELIELCVLRKMESQ